eukprot:TRINITY_DN13172_c0_g1_i1.p1 TRINITY_DN13172_c0_g1~~TRINITY_DN13172_c0_g1_i1.p1  ORF type:complete len:345 (+),score=84.08 TRINITY_DN13172_c0_g1_i1:62-1036(+)
MEQKKNSCFVIRNLREDTLKDLLQHKFTIQFNENRCILKGKEKDLMFVRSVSGNEMKRIVMVKKGDDMKFAGEELGMLEFNTIKSPVKRKREDDTVEHVVVKKMKLEEESVVNVTNTETEKPPSRPRDEMVSNIGDISVSPPVEKAPTKPAESPIVKSNSPPRIRKGIKDKIVSDNMKKQHYFNQIARGLPENLLKSGKDIDLLNEMFNPPDFEKQTAPVLAEEITDMDMLRQYVEDYEAKYELYKKLYQYLKLNRDQFNALKLHYFRSDSPELRNKNGDKIRIMYKQRRDLVKDILSKYNILHDELKRISYQVSKFSEKHKNT